MNQNEGKRGGLRPEIILKPCPFCGGDATVFSSGNHWPEQYFRILCKGTCCVQGKFYNSPEEAAEEWNRRAGMQVKVTFG